MRIEAVSSRFFEKHTLFSCPLCRASLSPAPPASLVCAGGHCFDLSRRGYASFHAGAKSDAYGKPLFEARRRVFEAGFYRPVLDQIEDVLRAFAPPSPVVADIGCGDGYYTRQLLSRFPATYIGLDLSREGITLAAAGGNEALWCVGDLARLPLASGSVDVLLDILTPSNYGEFARVLAPGGFILKAVPGAQYLQEIRALVSGQLRAQHYDDTRVRHYLAERMEIVDERRVTCTFPLTGEEARDFLNMTPMTLSADLSSVDTGALTRITIDLRLLIARMTV